MYTELLCCARSKISYRMRVRTVSSDIFCRLWKQYLQNGFGFCRPVLCIYHLWDTTTTLRISQWLMSNTAFSTSRPNLLPKSETDNQLLTDTKIFGKGSPRQGYDLCQVWTSRSDYSGGYGLPGNPFRPYPAFWAPPPHMWLCNRPCEGVGRKRNVQEPLSFVRYAMHILCLKFPAGTALCTGLREGYVGDKWPFISNL